MGIRTHLNMLINHARPINLRNRKWRNRRNEAITNHEHTAVPHPLGAHPWENGAELEELAVFCSANLFFLQIPPMPACVRIHVLHMYTYKN